MCMRVCGLQSGYLAAPVAVAAPSARACKTHCWQALWDFNTWIRAYEQVQRPSWNITSLDLTNAAWRIQCNKKKRGAVTGADTPPTTPLDAPRAIRHTRPGSVCHASIRSPQHHAQVAHTSWSPHPFRPHPHDDCTPRSQPSATPVTPKQIALSHLTTKALRPGMCEAPTTQAPLPPPRPRAHRRPRRPRDADTGTAPATVRRRLLSTLCKEIVTRGAHCLPSIGVVGCAHARSPTHLMPSPSSPAHALTRPAQRTPPQPLLMSARVHSATWGRSARNPSAWQRPPGRVVVRQRSRAPAPCESGPHITRRKAGRWRRCAHAPAPRRRSAPPPPKLRSSAARQGRTDNWSRSPARAATC